MQRTVTLAATEKLRVNLKTFVKFIFKAHSPDALTSFASPLKTEKQSSLFLLILSIIVSFTLIRYLIELYIVQSQIKLWNHDQNRNLWDHQSVQENLWCCDERCSHYSIHWHTGQENSIKNTENIQSQIYSKSYTSDHKVFTLKEQNKIQWSH